MQEIKVEKQRADNANAELKASAARSGLTEKEMKELQVREGFLRGRLWGGG